MKTKFLRLVAVLAIFGIVSPASAVTITLTFTGVTVVGGDAYTAVYVFDPAKTTNNAANHLPPTPNYFDIIVPTSATLTLNGITFPGAESGEIIICSVCVGANSTVMEVAAVSGDLTNILYALRTPNQFPASLDLPLNFSVISNTTGGQGSRGQLSGVALMPLSVNVSTSETPLPAALPLFASGLGALGLLGWRSRRRALSE
jgi:hypothetical protein